MSAKLSSLLLLVLVGALLVGAGTVQNSLNHDRDRLGLTRVQPLENAPPVLAFTTVALGGFRGLISNMLWMRATDLQDEDKFFEMAQLADWITKLEPHFVQVWLVQAWNLAYNISVKFKETSPGQYPDRWRYVKAGLELLRDDGLRFNPNETLIYRELAWFFQHKIGQNLDDASLYYKEQWSKEMARVFGKKKPDVEELNSSPDRGPEGARPAAPRDLQDGPRVHEGGGQGIRAVGVALAGGARDLLGGAGFEEGDRKPIQDQAGRPDHAAPGHLSVHAAKLPTRALGDEPLRQRVRVRSSLEIIPKVNFAYEQAAKEDEKNRDHIEKAHRNFLRDAVYFLYEYNRLADAAQWYRYLSTKYPDKPIIDGKPKSLPATVTLNQYAVSRVQGDVSESGGRDRTEGVLEGLLVNSYRNMVLGEDSAAAGFKLLAGQLWQSYQSGIPQERLAAVGLRPFEDIDKEVRRRMLDTQDGEAPEVRAVLRSKLGEPPEAAAPPATTNAPPQRASSQ